MLDDSTIIISISILIILCIISKLYEINYDYNENYQTILPNYYQTNDQCKSSCKSMDYVNCINCSDCGFSIDSSNKGQCIEGDVNGPFDKKDSVLWTFKNNTKGYPNGYENIYPYSEVV